MMSGLIPGPQQLGNEINTYFKPLVEDMKELWYNECKFGMSTRVNTLISKPFFVTVSDSPAACNLSG
jgi:hypothetical protein